MYLFRAKMSEIERGSLQNHNLVVHRVKDWTIIEKILEKSRKLPVFDVNKTLKKNCKPHHT